MTQPFLHGIRIRVLDVTGALAGPYCTTILSDLGADVIKIEPPGGDPLRQRLIGADRRPLPFDLVHRDKRSVVLDLKKEEGRRALLALASTADSLVENFRAGALAELGLGYDDLRESCPDLVYCSISGFGQFGPMRDAKGLDLIAQAYGGLISVTGLDDGTIVKPGFPLSDVGTGMWAAIGILAALHRARSGGGGAFIDVALADAIASWSLWEVADYVATGEVPGPLGTSHRLVAPLQAFTCSDGRAVVVGAVARHWPLLCDALGLDLGSDERFMTEWSRFEHRAELAEILQEVLVQQPCDHWVGLLREAGIPCGPVNTIDEVVRDQQFAERGMFIRDEGRHGTPVIVNTPIISDGAPRAHGRAPRAGEHGAGLLADAGYSDEEISALVVAGVTELATPGELTHGA